MPDYGKRYRFIFIEFKNADDATFAMNTMHGHPLDAKHIFLVNRFSDIESFINLDETYVEPKAEEYQPKVSSSASLSLSHSFHRIRQEHLRAWLGDSQGRDQYATYRGDEVEIHWHGKPSQCEVAHSKAVCAFVD